MDDIGLLVEDMGVLQTRIVESNSKLAAHKAESSARHDNLRKDVERLSLRLQRQELWYMLLVSALIGIEAIRLAVLIR